MVAKGALAIAGKITECLIIANLVLHKQSTSIRTFTYTEGTRNMLILEPGKKVSYESVKAKTTSIHSSKSNTQTHKYIFNFDLVSFPLDKTFEYFYICTT